MESNEDDSLEYAKYIEKLLKITLQRYRKQFLLKEFSK